VNGKMTAAVLYGKEDIKIEQVPIPRVNEGEVLIKVQVALTCGTDLKVYQRGYHARMIVPPALFGHELAGVIEEVGPGVRGFRRGMRVVALNSAPCGMCFYCSKHQENLCEDLLFNNGAYAEYIRVPRRIVETNMLAIPPHVTFEDAAMTEPLACVLRGLHETFGMGQQHDPAHDRPDNESADDAAHAADTIRDQNRMRAWTGKSRPVCPEV